MEISREEVLQIVINALNEAQEDLCEDSIEIVEETRPIGGLACFDSLTSVAVTVRCLDALDYDDELSMPTLFIDKNGTFLTVGEVVDRFLELTKKKK